MKQLKRRIFALVLSVSLLLLSGMTTFASGEGNIDGGGGGMGSGTATDVWHGQDGVRVTVVTADGSVASTPFDLSNANVANNVLNFGKVCKLQYSSGASLSPNGSYSYSKPGIALPRIISGTSSRASIEAIRRYFCSEYAAQLVADKAGIPFEELISGSYKLVIEPIAYFTHGGRNYAMTATEAALYNQKSGGTLRSKMPSLTHQNLPLSIFLETPDLGYPAWGGTYTVNDIVMPAGGSQVVWAKWHTPLEPTTLTIQVSVDGASTAKTRFIAKIVSLEENLPPDPLATDTNPHFSTPSLPSNPQKTSASWSVWSAKWHPNWEWESDWEWEDGSHGSDCPADCTSSHGHWVDNGEWVDNGWYDFTSTSYSASLIGSMEIHPDDIVPTAQGDNMKSGYGIKESATAGFSSNAPSSHYAPAQTAVSYFPEFGYDMYWRLLSCSGGMNATFAFKPNEFSTYNRNVHFTPVWYPDGTNYTVYTYIIDAWTPSGMLSVNVNDAVQIQGSLFDDWYTKRE